MQPRLGGQHVFMMTSTQIRRLIACVFVTSCSLVMFGCFATTYVEKERWQLCTPYPVKILAPGGSEYRLHTWEVRDSTIICIEGEAHFPSLKSGFYGKRFESFSGVVPIDSIKTCFCEEADVAGTVVGNLLLFVVTAPVVYLLYIAISGEKAL